MRDDLSGLTALLCVAEKRSFTAAAAELRVTPSAVSQSIRALEERVGVRLLQRTTRKVGLTEAGGRFITRLVPAMQGVREAFDALGELRDRPAGVLRLTVPRIGYEQILAPKLSAFLATYPDINLDISIDDAFVDIVEQGFDAGLRIGEMVDREMVGVRVTGELRMAVVGSPAYFAAHGKPKHPRDLHAHGGKDLEITVNGRLLLNDADVMLSAALDGHGLAYLIESSVREHVAAKRLVRVLDPFCTPFPGFFLYYPSRTHLAPKLQALVNALKLTSRKA